MKSRTALASMLVAVTWGCGGGGGGGTGTPPPSTPTPALARLSETGLYSAIGAKTIAPGLRSWTPQYPLWSDGSAKERWILLPAGTQIDTSDMDHWVFPVGTKIWKEFSFLGHRVETRLIEKVTGGASAAAWTFKSFQWAADESDAVEVSPNGVKDASPTAFGTTHDIPTLAECQACHGRGGDAVLGFDAVQLSGDVDPLVRPDGVREAADVTVDDLVHEGLVTHAPPRAERIRSSSAIGRWSMGLLHANCGNCHNPQGVASNTGLFLRHESAAVHEGDEPAYHTAVNQLETEYRLAGRPYRIKGHAPDESALLFRMASRAAGDQMPPIGSKVVDDDAVNRLHQWIDGLPRP